MESGAIPPSAAEMTVAEWEQLDEDEPGELVDSRLEEEEMPTALHEAVAMWLARALSSWVAPKGGFVFGSELKLIVGPKRGRKADVSMYLPGWPLPGKRRGATSRPPSVIVEVLSPRPRDVRRDTIDKMKDYAAFGVPYYWLVDPLARTIEIRSLARDADPTIVLAAAEGSHTVPGCDGLILELDQLWAEMDRLPEEEE